MKSYKEIAEAVLKRRDAYRASRRLFFKKTVTVISCIAAFGIVGLWSVLLSAEKSEPVHIPSFSGDGSSVIHSATTDITDEERADTAYTAGSSQPHFESEAPTEISDTEPQQSYPVEDSTLLPEVHLTESVSEPQESTSALPRDTEETGEPSETVTESEAIQTDGPVKEYEFPFFSEFKWVGVGNDEKSYEILMDMSSDGLSYFKDGTSLPQKLPLYMNYGNTENVDLPKLALSFADLVYGKSDRSDMRVEDDKVIYLGDDEQFAGDGITFAVLKGKPVISLSLCLADAELTPGEVLEQLQSLPYLRAAFEYLGIDDVFLRTLTHYKEGEVYAYSFSFSEKGKDPLETETNFFSGNLTVRYELAGENGGRAFLQIEGPVNYTCIGEYGYIRYEDAVKAKLDSLVCDPNYEYYRDNIAGKIIYMETCLPDGTTKLSPVYDFYYEFTDSNGNLRLGKPYSWSLGEDNPGVPQKLPWPLDFMN